MRLLTCREIYINYIKEKIYENLNNNFDLNSKHQECSNIVNENKIQVYLLRNKQ